MRQNATAKKGVDEAYTAAQVVEAVRGSGGFVSEVAKRLGCDRSTVYRHVARHATVRRAIEDERETMSLRVNPRTKVLSAHGHRYETIGRKPGP
jgi:transposase-like protein